MIRLVFIVYWLRIVLNCVMLLLVVVVVIIVVFVLWMVVVSMIELDL